MIPPILRGVMIPLMRRADSDNVNDDEYEYIMSESVRVIWLFALNMSKQRERCFPQGIAAKGECYRLLRQFFIPSATLKGHDSVLR